MDILSFLFRRHSEDENQELGVPDCTPPIPPVEEKPKIRLPDLFKEMPVEILGKDGQVIINGCITERNGREITVGRNPGSLSFKLCETGSGVMVRGRDSKMAQFYLRAIVAESSRVHIRLKNLVQDARDDLRDTFRLTVNTPVSVFYYEDTHMQFPEGCTLVDISTGGCCISSERRFEKGEALRLRIKLENYVAMNLAGEVIRVTERGDKDYSYGILFAQMEKNEQDTLARTLLNLRTGNRMEHSRVNGHW